MVPGIMALAVRASLAILFLSTAAAAEGADIAAAESLLASGNAALSQGEVATACARFAEAQKLSPGATTLEALATCHERQGKTATAWAELSEAARRSDGAQKTSLTERARALESQVAHLTIRVTTRGNTPLVTRDGAAISASRWGVAEAVDPGRHRIEIQTGTSDTHALVTDSVVVDVAPGESRVVDIPVAKGSMASASTQRTLGWVVAGLGVAALITGVVFEIQAARTASSGPICDDAPNGCPPDAANRASTRDGQRTFGVFSLGLGVAVTTAGVIMVSSAPSANPAPPPRAAMMTVGGQF